MSILLTEINKATNDAGGCLDLITAENYRKRYREPLKESDSQCPAPDETKRRGKRGRSPRSKARNILKRLVNFEDDVLRFMVEKEVPFSNNRTENDLRMAKVQQKISGCFRSPDVAKMFCRIRSYISNCRKHGLSASESFAIALRGLKLDLYAGSLTSLAILFLKQYCAE